MDDLDKLFWEYSYRCNQSLIFIIVHRLHIHYCMQCICYMTNRNSIQKKEEFLMFSFSIHNVLIFPYAYNKNPMCIIYNWHISTIDILIYISNDHQCVSITSMKNLSDCKYIWVKSDFSKILAIIFGKLICWYLLNFI